MIHEENVVEGVMVVPVLAELERGLQQGNYGAVVTCADAALRRHALPLLLRARLLRLKAMALWRMNAATFVGAVTSLLQDALEVPHADPVEHAKAAAFLAAAYCGDPLRATEYAERAESYGDQPALRSVAAAAWVNAGLANHRAGRLAEAEVAYLRALTLNEDVANPVLDPGIPENNLADVLLDGVRLGEACGWLDRAAARLAMERHGPAYLDLRARAACMQGALAEASRLVELALEHPASTDVTRAEAMLTRARILRAAGQHDEAKVSALEAFTRAGLVGHAWVCDRVVQFLNDSEEGVQSWHENGWC